MYYIRSGSYSTHSVELSWMREEKFLLRTLINEQFLSLDSRESWSILLAWNILSHDMISIWLLPTQRWYTLIYFSSNSVSVSIHPLKTGWFKFFVMHAFTWTVFFSFILMIFASWKKLLFIWFPIYWANNSPSEMMMIFGMPNRFSYDPSLHGPNKKRSYAPTI